MKRIVKFLRLPFIEKQLLLKSAFLLIAFKVGLSLFSFKSLLSYLDGIKQQKKELKDAYNPSEEKIVWVINVVSRYVPYTTSLSKALTAQVLLKRHGYLSNLRIGVVKNEKGKLNAHAWVESQGRIIIGDLKDLSRYTAFPSLKN
jgi:hypothetical protein